MLIQCNAWTLPQERYNAQWVKEKRVGIVLRSFREVAEGVRRILEPLRLAELRKNVAALENRAILEIPEMLAGLLATANETGQPPGAAGGVDTPPTV